MYTQNVRSIKDVSVCRTESVAGIAYINNGTMAVIEHMRPSERPPEPY
jgi:uncharacterized protein YacL